MKFVALSALAATMLLGLATAADAQQQGGTMQNMQGMDHSQMQNMPGMDHSNMAGTNMQGMDHGTVPRGRTAPAMKPSHPNAPTQPRTN